MALATVHLNTDKIQHAEQPPVMGKSQIKSNHDSSDSIVSALPSEPQHS